MHFNYSKFYFIILCFALFISCRPHPILHSPVKDGKIDLSHWNFNAKGAVSLTGSWKFYWKKHINPSGPVSDNYHLINVPGRWNTLKIDNKEIGSQGYGTYECTIKVNKKHKNLALKFGNFSGALNTYINGTIHKKIGTVGTSPKTSQSKYENSIIPFTLKNDHIHIVIHFSNYHLARSGITSNIFLGLQKDLKLQTNIKAGVEIFLVSSIFLMAIYHLIAFLLMKIHRAPLFFSLFCFTTSIRIFILYPRQFYEIFDSAPMSVYIQILMITFYLATLFFLLFIDSLFPNEIPSFIKKIYYAITTIFSLTAILLPTLLSTKIYQFYQIIFFPTALLIIFILARAFKRRKRNAGLILLGFIALALVVTLDILFDYNLVGVDINVPIGIFIFIIFQATALARKFAQGYKEVEILSEELEINNLALIDLNINLEKRVDERTEDLRIARDALWGEMRLAQRIQTILLPHRIDVKGYDIDAFTQPSEEVGGDYYDYIRTKEKDWFVIGDVAGHGVAAGLIMMMVQTSIHSMITQNPLISPAELLEHVNTVIKHNISHLDEDKYMTITIFATEKDGLFTYAGLHEKILIYRDQSSTVQSIESEGAWLGIMDTIAPFLKENSFTLNANDILLLYTDGITEAWVKNSIRNQRDPLTDMYGEKSLIKKLQDNYHKSSKDIIGEVLKSLDNYMVRDDITLMVLKRK